VNPPTRRRKGRLIRRRHLTDLTGAPQRPYPAPAPDADLDIWRARRATCGFGGDHVGAAERLNPAERLAFVLHDMFAMPFEQIAPIVERSPEATRQLASRARRRVRSTAQVPEASLTEQWAVVEAFLAAGRDGDFDALVAVRTTV
jgi:DNA-directed RNA polymerase specialized sigma24 family protein